jgi:phosphoribosyl-ATP pyrophosphohydrolase
MTYKEYYNSNLMANERLAELGQTLVSRRIEMPEGSSTTRLYREGPPRIIAKGVEELGEFFQALYEQDDNQVNAEASQALYYLFAWTVYKVGNLDGLLAELEKKQPSQRGMPQTLGHAVRKCSESMGRAYQGLLSEAVDSDECNLRVAEVIFNFQDAMAAAGKGSWEGVLAEI